MDTDVEPGRNNAALVQAPGQVDDDLPGTVVVDDFELTNVTYVRIRRTKKKNVNLATEMNEKSQHGKEKRSQRNSLKNEEGRVPKGK